MEVTLRPAVTEDAADLAAIQAASWNAAFVNILTPEILREYTDCARLEEMYRNILASPELHLTLELVNDVPHGLAARSASRDGEPQTAELICIHSRPGNWGKGYGAALMRHALLEMENAGYSYAALWVFAENHRARRFYEALGFAPTGAARISFGCEEVQYRKPLTK